MSKKKKDQNEIEKNTQEVKVAEETQEATVTEEIQEEGKIVFAPRPDEMPGDDEKLKNKENNPPKNEENNALETEKNPNLNEAAELDMGDESEDRKSVSDYIKNISSYIGEHQKLIGRSITALVIAIIITLAIVMITPQFLGVNRGTGSDGQASANDISDAQSSYSKNADQSEQAADNAADPVNSTDSDTDTDGINNENGTNAIEDQKSQDVIKLINADAFELLGIPVDDVTQIPGDGVENRLKNTCYYKSCGATLNYDEKTHAVTGVEMGDSEEHDIDTQPAYDFAYRLEVLGIHLGEDISKAKSDLSVQDIDAIDLTDDCFICAFNVADDKNTTYELYVSGTDGTVTYICLEAK